MRTGCGGGQQVEELLGIHGDQDFCFGEARLKGFCAIVVATLVMVLPGTAVGLSCARPSLDKAAIDTAIMIFEGTAGPKRLLDFRERTNARLQSLESKGGTTEDLRVYEFEVTRGWEGALTGQRVDVLFNNYWGDGFAEGGDYLIVSTQQVGDLAWAPLCGHSIDLVHAAELGNLALLERVIGIGEHMKVRMEDRVCRRDADCTSVQTHCGRCSCGSPVAKGAVERYAARFERLCAIIRIAERCEMDCPPPASSCRTGICVAE